MIKTFKYRLYPNRSQRRALDSALDTCRELYNMALEQRRYQHIGKYEQMRQVTILRNEVEQYGAVSSYLLEDVIKRLDRAFLGFFRRCKTGKKPGFPRFKGRDRYDSLNFRDTAFRLCGARVQLSRLGSIKLKLSRPCSGDIRTCVIKRRCGNWYACFAVEIAPTPLPASEESIGIDVGVENFAALSNGEFIENPRFYQRTQAQLRRLQRKVARKRRGSERRRTAVDALAKFHESTGARRNDFLHKRTRELINRYGLIVVEDLNVAGLAGGMLAKQVHDVSWGQFFRQLAYKAAEAGRELVAVNCRGTSQECPACGNKKKKALSERTHKCAECGLVMHRDTAAAQVILGRAGLSGVNVGALKPCVV